MKNEGVMDSVSGANVNGELADTSLGVSGAEHMAWTNQAESRLRVLLTCVGIK